MLATVETTAERWATFATKFPDRAARLRLHVARLLGQKGTETGRIATEALDYQTQTMLGIIYGIEEEQGA